jgi:hypothetical protein
MMAALLWILGCIVLSTLLLDLVCYAALTPDIDQPRTPPIRSPEHLSRAIYAISYGPGLLRAPYAVLPYLGKCFVFLLLRQHFLVFWYRPSIQIVRLSGDFANLALTTLLLMRLLDNAPSGVMLLFHVCFFAESIRVISEKLQTAISGFWQILPHRRIAAILRDVRIPAIRRYTAYYELSPDDRASRMLCYLREALYSDVEASRKLSYLRQFRIVPDDVPLRTGNVRDIALGEVYIHSAWTNDPWLLIGQALRRSPWIFDPRYVERPIYYRTHTNRLCTQFVFDHGQYALPYAIYQFGHEIKVARYDAFYRAASWLGFPLEEPVRADGTFRGDAFLRLIGRMTRIALEGDNNSMLCEEDIWKEIEATAQRGEILTPLEIARRYACPLCYVEEVLLPQVYAENAARIASATA